MRNKKKYRVCIQPETKLVFCLMIFLSVVVCDPVHSQSCTGDVIVNLTNGQIFVVPNAITQLSVTVKGAQGGDSDGQIGGLGAQLTAQFLVLPGDTLLALVGLSGLDGINVGTNDGSGGGGGGSAIINSTSGELLAVASGGGGAGSNDPGGSGGLNLISTNGIVSGIGGTTLPSDVFAGGAGGGFGISAEGQDSGSVEGGHGFTLSSIGNGGFANQTSTFGNGGNGAGGGGAGALDDNTLGGAGGGGGGGFNGGNASTEEGLGGDSQYNSNRIIGTVNHTAGANSGNGSVQICFDYPTLTTKEDLHIEDGDLYVELFARGVILSSPSGDCWRVRIGPSGQIETDSVTCP